MKNLFTFALLATISVAAVPSANAADVIEEPLPVSVTRAFENLIFDRPIAVTHANDGSNRVFVAEQEGIVKWFENDPDVEEANVFLDIDKRCRYRDNNNEEGFLGFAFHPKFKDNGQVFALYTTATEDHTSFVSRFTLSKDDPNKVDADSEEIVMKIPQPYWNHNGGTIVFGPDGYLYIALGDGGSGSDPHGNGQNLRTLLASILRIDVDKKADGREYAIPADNPFINHDVVINRKGKTAKAMPEIYAYGLRNVWRMAFDRETGKLWAGDVGQGVWEEINIIEKGGNYGWNIREASHWFRPDGNDTKSPEMIDPVWEYHHDVGKSITGGTVYRGKEVPELVGKYVYGDYVTGLLWALEHDGTKTVANYSLKFEGDKQPIMSFGDDESGEVYFATRFGQLFKFKSDK